MKKIFIALFTLSLLTSCGNDAIILPKSVGNFGQVLVVVDNSKWQGNIGHEIRQTFGKLQVGLPQPEKTLSTSQIPPRGFNWSQRVVRKMKPDRFRDGFLGDHPLFRP